MNTQVATKRTTAFTLIELLIVVAIIGILASILFPVFARARENARRSSCLNNLKQIGLGMMQYSQDYDEMMPIQKYSLTFNFMDSGAGFASSAAASGATTNLFAELQPYIKSSQVFSCPSAVPFINTPCTVDCQAPTATSRTNYLGNAVIISNEWLGTSLMATFKPRSLASIPAVSQTIVVHERNYAANGIFLYPRREEAGSPATASYPFFHHYSAGVEYFDNNHFDGGNLLFCDGHVKWRKYTELWSGDFGLTPNEKWSTTNAHNSTGDTYFKAAF